MLAIRELRKSHPDPTSPNYDTPTAQLHQICIENALGDVLVFIEWRLFTGPLFAPFFSTDESFDPEWEFARRAVKARPTP